MRVRCMVSVCLLLCILTATAITAGEEEWESLFDGKTLKGWKVTDFGGQGKVEVKDDIIILNMGVGNLTGITWTGPVRRMNYEIYVDAMRLAGHDFFCGLTFPVGDSCCSLICGGWGGSLVGISSFDDMDASENETTTHMDFESDKWYPIRVRVTEGRIEAWIDGKKMVDARPGKRKISVRGEVDLSQPLGIAAWRTKAAIGDVRVRSLESKKGGEKPAK
ncbi:MAG: DUF1080 domain-containing protein [Planctomycetes bacterium]|nr:DUF1080 domain-containing protein [Planctomycetota bacterium]